MYLYGASGHGKVVYDIVRANGIEVTAFIDKKSKDEFLGLKVLDESFCSEIDGDLIISIGNNETRKELVQKLNVKYAKAVHPSAIVAPSVQIETGTVVMHGAIIQAATVIGKHTIVNTGATIDHDCKIHDFVHIGPGVRLCGNVIIGEGTLVGAGSIVIPGREIGSNCKIGAGTVVIEDIPDNAVVVGNPGRIIKKETK